MGILLATALIEVFAKNGSYKILRLWQIEAVPEATILSPDDALCENMYNKTCTRTNTDRIVVSLPFWDILILR